MLVPFIGKEDHPTDWYGAASSDGVLKPLTNRTASIQGLCKFFFFVNSPFTPNRRAHKGNYKLITVIRIRFRKERIKEQRSRFGFTDSVIHKITSPNSGWQQCLTLGNWGFSFSISLFSFHNSQFRTLSQSVASLSLSGSRSLSHLTPPQVLNTCQWVWEFLYSSRPTTSCKPGTPNRTSQQSTVLNTINRLEFYLEFQNFRIL